MTIKRVREFLVLEENKKQVNKLKALKKDPDKSGFVFPLFFL